MTVPADAAASAIDDLCRARVAWIRDGRVGLTLDGTSYEIHLAIAGDASRLPKAGKRTSGVIHGKALRMHRAGAGGRFIEPVLGHPRIVQGTVMATDPAANRMLADVVVPMWLELEPDQPVREFATGDLVNFYCASGMTFAPADRA